jgi:WD40 repeat protein
VWLPKKRNEKRKGKEKRGRSSLTRILVGSSCVLFFSPSPDSHILVSGAADGSIKLWDLPFIRQGLAELDLDW